MTNNSNKAELHSNVEGPLNDTQNIVTTGIIKMIFFSETLLLRLSDDITYYGRDGLENTFYSHSQGLEQGLE
jgi:hypothetical protein